MHTSQKHFKNAEFLFYKFGMTPPYTIFTCFAVTAMLPTSMKKYFAD